ncbi:MAG: DUF3540 domain-containing protein [Pseudomonadota bacterium]
MLNTSLPQSATALDKGISLVSATVTGQADKWFFLGDADGADRALRADSCLIAPECGDTVLVCRGVTVGVTSVPYILAVLSRAHPSHGVLALPGGAAITAGGGKLAFTASEITMEGGQSVSVSAPQVEMKAVEAAMQFVSLRTSIRDLRGVLGNVTTVAQSINSTVGRLLQKATNSFRWTENLDETRAGRMRLQVAERFHLKSKHTSMISEGQVKIDAEKIDLG